MINAISKALKTRVLIIDVKTDLIIELFLIVKECMGFLTNEANQKIVLDLMRDYLQTREDFIRLVLFRILDPDEGIQEKGKAALNKISNVY